MKKYILIMIVMAITLPITLTQMVDPDGFWHIFYGKLLCSGHVFNWSDYYYTPVSENYTNWRFTFLGDIILYLAHCLGGINALITFRILCVFSCVFFLFSISDKKQNALKLFVLTVMVIGIYQKTLIRNSMFALVFFPTAIYFFEKKKYKSLAATILIWMMCHGSFLIGVVLIPILFVSNRRLNVKTISLLIAAFIVIYSFSPLVRSSINFNQVKSVYSGIVETKSLNQTIWKPKEGTSVDFKDPLKHDMVYIKITIFFALFTLCIIKPRLRYYIPFLSICFIGFGYVRLVGYSAIMSAYTILKCENEGNLRKIDQGVYATLFLFVFILISCFHHKIIYEITRTGLGASAMKYPVSNGEYSLEYGRDNTWYTMSLGGYILNEHWPLKRVNIDTFWEPHQSCVFENYKAESKNPDLIRQQTALVGLNDILIIQRMTHCKKKWYPERIDSGTVFFNRAKTDLYVHITPEEIKSMTQLHRNFFATVLNYCGMNVKDIERLFSGSLSNY